jgi:hypothetical protein
MDGALAGCRILPVREIFILIKTEEPAVGPRRTGSACPRFRITRSIEER